MKTITGLKPYYRLTFLCLCLLLEIVWIIRIIDLPNFHDSELTEANRSVLNLFESIKEFWPIFFWILAGCSAFLTPNLNAIKSFYLRDIRDDQCLIFLAMQLIAFFGFFYLSVLQFDKRYLFAYLTHGYFVTWLLLGGLVFVLWLLALAPSEFWKAVFHNYRYSLFFGTLLGSVVGLTVFLFVRQEAPLGQQALWTLFSGLTLQIVHSLLSVVYSDLVFEPETLETGTSEFPIKVTYACSGIEGIALIIGFLCVYVYLFRSRLQFPQVWWLFPIGIIAIWLANCVRIALLIVIGHEISPSIALNAFHAQAGWVAFTLIALMMISLVHRLQFFSLPSENQHAKSYSHQLAVALLAPWLVQIGSSMLTSAFTDEFDFLYPLRIGLITAVLYRYRRIYRGLALSASWEALLTGLAVFVVWMILEPMRSSETLLSVPELDNLPMPYIMLWIIFRCAGSVIVVPLAEEFAFRGYLIRKLISSDFENIPSKTFSWLSFLGSSLIFGILHERWLAGFIAGMSYALIQYRHGRIGDAVAAHMTTNALIALSVLVFGQWSLWQ